MSTSAISVVRANSGADLIAAWMAEQLASGYFVMGEGGYHLVSLVKTPDTPSASQQRLASQGTKLTGNVTLTNGSTAVTGSGTNFTSQLSAGVWIRPDNDVTLPWAQIQSVTDNTHATLTGNYVNPTLSGGAASYAAVPYYMKKKALTALTAVYGGSGTRQVQITAFLDTGEGNGPNQQSADPEYFECGVFDANGKLVYYSTFAKETKTNLVTLTKSFTATY